MLDRLSVNTLLKFVIAALASAVVVVLSLGAWDSWGRLAVVNRIAAVADASGYLFTALHNLRVDRASTFRDLSADKQFTAVNPLVKEVRAAEMPALNAALATLEDIAAGLPVPARFTEAVEKAKRDFFSREFTDLRMNTLKSLIAGEKPGITVEQWTPMTIAKLTAVLGVAEAALEAAKDRATS